MGTVTLPITRALDLSAIGSVTSGAPFTPVVGSDINGDGARNDRAFIFDPATAADAAVANGMRALLATAPSAVRGCLRSQLGRIAARNSCSGPWQPSLDLQLNWRPAWFGLDRRLTMSLLTVNLLGGLDEWLHGASHLHGWGYATAPDPVLLYARAFDPATNRFRYDVNGRFGTTASASSGVTVPFQIAFQGRVAIGPIRLRARPSPGARPGLGADGPVPQDVAARFAELLANPVVVILGLRDSLGFSSEQVARLQVVSDSLDARNRPIADSLQAEAQRAGDGVDPTALLRRFGPKLTEGQGNTRRALERARAILTPEQWSALPDALKSPARGASD